MHCHIELLNKFFGTVKYDRFILRKLSKMIDLREKFVLLRDQEFKRTWCDLRLLQRESFSLYLKIGQTTSIRKNDASA